MNIKDEEQQQKQHPSFIVFEGSGINLQLVFLAGWLPYSFFASCMGVLADYLRPFLIILFPSKNQREVSKTRNKSQKI